MSQDRSKMVSQVADFWGNLKRLVKDSKKVLPPETHAVVAEEVREKARSSRQLVETKDKTPPGDQPYDDDMQRLKRVLDDISFTDFETEEAV